MIRLPTIYPITDRILSGMSHAEQVEQLIAGGAKFIQLREKHATPAEFYAEAVKALAIARKAGAAIIINDRVDIALASGADGVHLGQTDMPVLAARKLLGSERIIGLSTHNLAQVEAALALPLNYIAFGPIFVTGTKEKPDPVTGLKGLRTAKAALGGRQLVAIGGITRMTVAAVLGAGADAAAVISDLFEPSKPIGENLRLLTDLAANG